MRARTSLVATTVVAVVLVGGVAALAWAVEQTMVRQVQAQAEAEVQAVTDRLAAGMSPTGALRPTAAPDLIGGNVFTYVAILDDEGSPVVDSGFFAIAGVGEVAVSGDGRAVRVGSPDLAIAQRSVEVDGRLLLVVAASPVAQAVRSVDAIVRTSLIGVPLVIAFVGAVTWTATGRTLRPIDRIRIEVDELSSRTLDRRIPVPDTDDEVARLAETMNRMLRRLAAASASQREFVSDASHELRGPVAAIRAELEVALAHPGASGWREVATSVLTETGRIERIVEDLLLLARLDEGVARSAGIVDVGELVRASARRASDSAVDIQVNVHVADGLLVRGRDDDITSVIRNLLDNAVRHAAATVAVTAATSNGTVTITVDDDGPGIPPADRERVFARFTRLDPARGNADGGVGLGLAVVDRVVRHQGGSVVATESPAGGARFTVELPAAPANRTPIALGSTPSRSRRTPSGQFRKPATGG